MEDEGMDETRLLIADRSERPKLRFKGPQAAWFLHQVLTQAFEDIQPGEARDAAMITTHGRMTGYLETLATEDAILAHFEPELAGALPETIQRYVFATQVEIEDVSDAYGLVLIVGETWREMAAEVAGGSPLHPTTSLGAPAGYVWAARSEVDALLEALDENGGVRTSEDELEGIRVANGVARWGREMDEKTFPQEAAIDDRAVHFDKGCYLGQEAMAKIHFRGKVNRRLAQLSTDGVLTPGVDLEAEGARVGKVTSVAGGKALGIVKHTIEPGAVVHSGDVDVKVIA
jgi:folate-binding protein YgfZ